MARLGILTGTGQAGDCSDAHTFAKQMQDARAIFWRQLVYGIM